MNILLDRSRYNVLRVQQIEVYQMSRTSITSIVKAEWSWSMSAL